MTQRTLVPTYAAFVRARFEVRQQQSTRFTWFGHANAALLPTTDLIDLRGIPYRKTGAKTADGRGGGERYLQVRNLLLRHGDDVQWGDTGKG